MRRAHLSLAGFAIAALGATCACGGRTSPDDYGYRSSSRLNVANAAGRGGSAGNDGIDGARGGTAGQTTVEPPPNRNPPNQNPPNQNPPNQNPPNQNPPDEPPPPEQPPPEQPLTCGQVTQLFNDESLQGELGGGPGSFQSTCGGGGFEQHYLFVAPHAGEYTFDTLGSSIDTVLSVHDGDCFGPELTCNDDANGVTSRVQVMLNENQQVMLRVDSFVVGGGPYIVTSNGLGDVPCVSQDLASNLGAGVYSGTLSGEPSGIAACVGSGPTLAVLWTAPFEGSFTFDTIGSNFDTVLSVSTSCAGESLGCNDDNGFDTTSAVTVYLLAGASVVVFVQAFGGAVQPGLDQYTLNIQDSTFL